MQNDVELKAGEVLLCSEQRLAQMAFNSNNYNTSTVKNFVQALYDNDLGLTEEEKNMIQPQTLRTKAYNTTAISTDQKLFIFSASSGDNFHYGTYGVTGVCLWYRSYSHYESGLQTHKMQSTNNGGTLTSTTVSSNMYVRPGMVLKLA